MYIFAIFGGKVVDPSKLRRYEAKEHICRRSLSLAVSDRAQCELQVLPEQRVSVCVCQLWQEKKFREKKEKEKI